MRATMTAMNTQPVMNLLKRMTNELLYPPKMLIIRFAYLIESSLNYFIAKFTFSILVISKNKIKYDMFLAREAEALKVFFFQLT